jgi:chromosome segregation ATPase
MDDQRSEAEARMRQSLGLSEGMRQPVADDPQRLARQAIRAQAAARDYAERQLARAEHTIEELRAKLQSARREKVVAIEAARAANDTCVQADRKCRAAEVALGTLKSVSDGAQREAREARTLIQELRTKLALAHQAAEALQAQFEQERQARHAAEQARLAVPPAMAVGAIEDASDGQPAKRRRGRPPGKRDATVPRQPASKRPKAYAADQAPVRWWADGWTPPSER